MNLGGPPTGVAPEVLFRSLLGRSPSAPLSFKFSFQHSELVATALPALDVASCFDAAPEVALPSLMARSLRADGLLAFHGPDEILELTEAKYETLAKEFLGVFIRICPVVSRCDAKAWLDVLEKGASHNSNEVASSLLGTSYECFNDSRNIRIVDRPDLYFGVPKQELLDGHWLCYRAARRLDEQRYQKR
jgi:hypothetical protein